MPTTFISSMIGTFLSDPMLIFILAAVFGVLGFIMSLVYGSNLRADGRSSKWPRVPGKVISARIEKRSNFSYSTHNYNTRYVPVIKYSYNVADTPYQAEKIGNGIYIGMTRDSLKHWSKRYPAHTEVQVYYNPADPKDAVLEPTSNSNIVGFMVAIAIDLLGIFLFGLWIYQLLIRR